MATQYEQITDRLAGFIREQQMFFVATAARDGRVNVSPKGLDSLSLGLSSLGSPEAVLLA